MHSQNFTLVLKIFINFLKDEPGLEGVSSTATLTIQRNAGLFTDVTVDWEVTTSGASSDISPTRGTVTFNEGQTTGTFSISALEDEVMFSSCLVDQ